METYRCSHDLARFGETGENRPELWEKLNDFDRAVVADGALTVREKGLIAPAVAHSAQCPYRMGHVTCRA